MFVFKSTPSCLCQGIKDLLKQITVTLKLFIQGLVTKTSPLNNRL